MKGVVAIIARLGSTRLSQKHLIVCDGEPLIAWLYRRMEYAVQKAGGIPVVICTSEKPENKQFADFFANVFYGSDENIPQRLLQCAQHYSADFIVSIDGDDILCSTAGVEAVVGKMQAGASYVSTQGLPFGMNVSSYSTQFLETSLSEMAKQKLETGWGRIFDKRQHETIVYPEFENNQALRLTLDYEEDAEFFCKIIEGVGPAVISMPDAALVSYINKNGYYTINSFLNKAYWENFNKNINKENEII